MKGAISMNKSIMEVLDQLEQTIRGEVGLKPSIKINFFPTDNPALSFTPAALSAAEALARAGAGKKPEPQEHNGCTWFKVGDKMTIFYDDIDYNDYRKAGWLD